MARIIFNHFNLRRGRTYLLVLLAVGCIGWGCYALVEMLRPVEKECVRLAAGSAVARRFQIAQRLAGEARAGGLDVDVVATKGFDDSMRQVSEGKLDMAVISSGLQASGCENVRLLAGLDVAPLHILVRRELAESGLSLIEAVKGRRVNLGAAGTNDRQLASDVLGFLRLSPRGSSGGGDYTESSLSKDELTRLAKEIQSLSGSEREERLRELPDVVMSVSSLPSLVVQRLLDTNQYCLMPFPYAQPFLMSNLENGKSPADGVNRSYVETLAIPAAMYLGKSPIPAGDCPTVGMRTLLVARADLPKATVEHLMRIVFETDFARRIKPLGPREIATAYEIHDGAAAYLDRNNPLFTSQFCEHLSGAFSIFGAFSAGALSIYGYLRKRRIRRPGEYIDQIRMVDAMLSEHEVEGTSAAKPEALVRELDGRLLKLKEQLIHDYCNNRVEGEMVVLSILSMVADSRAELRRSARRTTEDGANAGLASIELGSLRVA